MIDPSWYEAQAKACRSLADDYPPHSGLWAAYIREAQEWGHVAAALRNLNRAEADTKMLEAARRKKLDMDDRDYWTRQQIGVKS